MTRKIARDLATSGILIVSGLAVGIDAAAHQAALNSGGRTWAFLPSGFANLYPPEHRELAEQIAEQGAVLSEFTMNAKPLRQHFPSRNRLISGASLGVLIVQAPAKSGALITARNAMEQNREVFALPGRVDEPGSEGPHQLIQDGAKLVANGQDIIEELRPLLSHGIDGRGDSPRFISAPQEKTIPAKTTRPGRPKPDKLKTPPVKTRLPDLTDLDPDDRRIVLRLEHGPLHIDRLAADLDLPVRKVSERMLILEMKGVILRLPGMSFDLA